MRTIDTVKEKDLLSESNIEECCFAHQSPIDIVEAIHADLFKLKLSYTSGVSHVENNGYSLKFHIKPGSMHEYGLDQFELKEFHYHTPSEHHIKSKQKDMELHFVHQNENSEFLVIAVLINKAEESNKVMKKLASYANKEDINNNCNISSEEIRSILPTNLDYYNYKGSLTTPPFDIPVKWVVLKDLVGIDLESLKAFQSLNGKNAREVQSLEGREVLTNKTD